jgi:hypothetical protein
MRKKLITAASAANVSPGWMNEMIPVAMNATARNAESSFHQPVDVTSADRQLTPREIRLERAPHLSGRGVH